MHSFIVRVSCVVSARSTQISSGAIYVHAATGAASASETPHLVLGPVHSVIGNEDTFADGSNFTSSGFGSGLFGGLPNLGSVA